MRASWRGEMRRQSYVTHRPRFSSARDQKCQGTRAPSPALPRKIERCSRHGTCLRARAVTRIIKGWLNVALAAVAIPALLPASVLAGTTVRRTAAPPPPPPATAPLNLTATAGNARVTLAWEPVEGA